MSLSLRNVLISDAVDSACVELLQSHGINVTCKFKLPKDQLLQEIKVSPVHTGYIHNERHMSFYIRR